MLYYSMRRGADWIDTEELDPHPAYDAMMKLIAHEISDRGYLSKDDIMRVYGLSGISRVKGLVEKGMVSMTNHPPNVSRGGISDIGFLPDPSSRE